MKKLYPLKFNPIYKEKIWGGTKLKNVLNKNTKENANTGESWELSGVKESLSVVSNGFLKGNNIQEIIEIYMDEIVGEEVYKKFGIEFPLLFKFIDANDKLSIQVHPDDKLAKKRHKAYGKTEMWYVLESSINEDGNEKNAQLIMGFNKEIDKKYYIDVFEQGKLKRILNFVDVKSGDVFFIPAGRVHAIGKGILLAEIQQTSDITYRIYDWDRTDKDGNSRELHVKLAVDAIDYEYKTNFKTNYKLIENESLELAKCQYFTTNIIDLKSRTEKDYISLDSFVVYMCVEGEFEIEYDSSETLNVKKGETVLIPAEMNNLFLKPVENSKILEIYIGTINNL